MTAHRRLGLDRHRIRSTMQRHINERWQASMMDFGRGNQYPTCRDYIAREQNHAFYTLRREIIIRKLWHYGFPQRHEHYLYLWRVVFHPQMIRLKIGAHPRPL